MYCFRLNITPPASPVFGSSPKSGRRSVKRVRTEEETVGTKYSHQGYIQIKEANADGKYVKLFNSGSQVSVFNGCFLCFYFFLLVFVKIVNFQDGGCTKKKKKRFTWGGFALRSKPFIQLYTIFDKKTTLYTFHRRWYGMPFTCLQ